MCSIKINRSTIATMRVRTVRQVKQQRPRNKKLTAGILGIHTFAAKKKCIILVIHEVPYFTNDLKLYLFQECAI